MRLAADKAMPCIRSTLIDVYESRSEDCSKIRNACSLLTSAFANKAGPEFVVNQVLGINGDRHARGSEERGSHPGAPASAALIPSSRRPESASAFP